MEFDKKSVESNIPPFNGEQVTRSRKVVLKLTSKTRGMKAYRTLPKDFDDLVGLITKYQKDETDPSTVKLSYQDDAGDVIGVSDDEDLMTAIEWAESTPTKDLKLRVSSKKPEQKQQQQKPEKKLVKKDITSIIDKPMAQLSLSPNRTKLTEKDRLKLKMRGKPPAEMLKALKEGRLRRAETSRNQKSGSSSSSSDSEKDKDNRKAMQRKMIRKMIHRTMGDHQRQYIKNLIKEDLRKKRAQSSSGEETKENQPTQQQAETVHGRRSGPHFMHRGPMPIRRGPVVFCGPHGPMNRQMKNKIGYLMRQMFGQEAMHSTDDNDTDTGDFVVRKNPRRAIPVRDIAYPTKTFVACPGEEFTVELKFRNGKHKPYAPNFHLESSLNEATQAVFAPVKVPLPETAPNETFTVKVPVKILETAETFDQEMTLLVGVTNKNGKEVGFAVPIKVKLIEKIDETALYDKAMQLMAQTGMSQDRPDNFEKAVKVLKEAGYHVDKACAMLIAEAPADTPETKK